MNCVASRRYKPHTLGHSDTAAGNDSIGGERAASPLFIVRGFDRNYELGQELDLPSGSQCSGTGRIDTCQLAYC